MQVSLCVVQWREAASQASLRGVTKPLAGLCHSLFLSTAHCPVTLAAEGPYSPSSFTSAGLRGWGRLRQK